MDKKKGAINVAVSIAFRVVLLVGTLLTRRFLIKYIGNEANGLDSLYSSIIGFLSVAELGIGTAITYCMYKPIVDGDNDKVSALYFLFRKIYFIIGAIILVAGCAIMPLLPVFAKGYSVENYNIYLTFALFLVSIVLTYAFSAQISLNNAYKNNYISTSIQSGGQVLQCILQIVVLVVSHSFIWFLFCRIVASLFQWVITEIIARRRYRTVITNKQAVDADTKKEVVKNVKAMFMHKIGGVLVNTADSLIISAFIGVIILGKYTNYTTIMTAMSGTIMLFFTPLASVLGHMFIQEDSVTVQKYYNFFHTFNFVIGCLFFLGYYGVIDNLVTLCFGGGLELPKSISYIITLNYFIQFMRQATLLFRDASGTFYNDRWKPLFEGILNVALSIGFVYLFGYIWGEDMSVVGVIVATIVTNLLICHVVEPYVLYKYGFRATPKKYYIRNYFFIGLFTAALTGLHFIMISDGNEWVEMFANGGISVAVSTVICVPVVLLNKDFRHYLKHFILRVKNRLVHSAAKPIPEENGETNNDVNDIKD